MTEEITRRGFLERVAGGLVCMALPIAKGTAMAQESKSRIPILMCSRGEEWGKKALQPGWEILSGGGHILDAVERCANVVEIDPEDSSVGYGGLPNEDGDVELDASIMFGPTHRCGAVAALRRIKTPSSVARLVMERSDHMLLVGEGALRFALAHGFKEEDLLTEKSRLEWLKWKENMSEKDDWLPPAGGKYGGEGRPQGTINVLAVGGQGDMAGITSTSGLAFKIRGRVGDSPIIGAGLYLDNRVGAAGATGRGEEVIRTCGSFHVVEQMRRGMTPQEACEAACGRIVEVNGGIENVKTNPFNDKFIAISVRGEIGCAAILGSQEKPPQASFMDETGFHVVNGSFLIESGS